MFAIFVVLLFYLRICFRASPAVTPVFTAVVVFNVAASVGGGGAVSVAALGAAAVSTVAVFVAVVAFVGVAFVLATATVLAIAIAVFFFMFFAACVVVVLVVSVAVGGCGGVYLSVVYLSVFTCQFLPVSIYLLVLTC